MRERIEAEVNPAEKVRRENAARQPEDAGLVLEELREFVALARAGAYMAGDRRVSPKERSRWRFTFHDLATRAQSALSGEDVDTAASAVELLVDFARELNGRDYVRSEDPVEAARLVVSDAVAGLWIRMREAHGFAEFARRSAPQLVRWESRHGWTRFGGGRISEKETSLAQVLRGMLTAPDLWTAYADCYLEALDELGGAPSSGRGRAGRSRSANGDWGKEKRTADLAEWHLALVGRLAGSEDEDRLDRLVEHPALAGPELTYLQARLAHVRGEDDRARVLVHESLKSLPGHGEFLSFAAEIDAPAPLPPRAAEIARSWA
jgi:hypothetical protein